MISFVILGSKRGVEVGEPWRDYGILSSNEIIDVGYTFNH